MFVAVSHVDFASEGQAMYSADGANWTPTTLSGGKRWRDVAYGNGRFIAVGEWGVKAAASVDGITWTPLTLPSEIQGNNMAQPQGVCFANGRFYVVSRYSNLVAHSSDGQTWETATLPTQNSGYISISYAFGTFFAIVANSNVAYRSRDLINWVDISTSVSRRNKKIVGANDKIYNLTAFSEAPALLYITPQYAYRTSAAQDIIDAGKATAAQGAKADSALQSGAAISTISGLQTALDGKVTLSESSYIIAKPGDNLAAKYAAAKALTPNGAVKSNTNRASLIILPGRYTLSAELLIDEEFVDVLGLGSQMHRAAVLIVDVSGMVYTDNVPNVSANNVRILGIGSSGYFKITGDKPLQVFENCTSELSGFYPIASGTFTGCRAGPYSFGGNIGAASGTFTNCSSGSGSFGTVASGRFTNCTNASNYTICSGTFTNCSGGEASFGTYAAASGVFIGCTGGRYSFGGRPSGTSNATGVFINCRLTAETFRPLAAPATGKALMVNCIDGNGDIIEGQAPL